VVHQHTLNGLIGKPAVLESSTVI